MITFQEGDPLSFSKIIRSSKVNSFKVYVLKNSKGKLSQKKTLYALRFNDITLIMLARCVGINEKLYVKSEYRNT
jgi:hypothetical protein